MTVTEPDLHGDAEQWPDGLGEPGEFQLHRPCEHCGCHGTSTAVRFVPVDENGGGILTVDDIEERLDRATLNLIEMAEREEAGRLAPISDALGGDVIMHIEGYRDGSFRAKLLQDSISSGQSRTRYGKGSTYRGARGWSIGLSASRFTRQDTRPEEAEAGLIAYWGEPGVLNFSKHTPKYFDPDVPGSEEAYRLRRANKDRGSRLDYYARHRTDRPESQPPAEGEEKEAGTGTTD